jgi:SpoVK/Ycf46/Vps4 family AAA+-type ATPase
MEFVNQYNDTSSDEDDDNSGGESRGRSRGRSPSVNSPSSSTAYDQAFSALSVKKTNKKGRPKKVKEPEWKELKPYQVLGISRESTEQEIKKAYLMMARQWHPDKGGNDIALQAINNARDSMNNGYPSGDDSCDDSGEGSGHESNFDPHEDGGNSDSSCSLYDSEGRSQSPPARRNKSTRQAAARKSEYGMSPKPRKTSGKKPAKSKKSKQQLTMQKYVLGLRKDVSNKHLDDLLGLDAAKEIINEILVMPAFVALHPEEFGIKMSNQNIGVLLYGEPGCGKTCFAQAAANAIPGITFYQVDWGKVDRTKGAEFLHALFEEAKASSPSIIFIDEINGALKSDTNARRTFQQRMSAMKDWEETVLVIGATNHLGNIGNAALSRFAAQIEVPLPNATGLEALIQLYMKKTPLKVITITDGGSPYTMKLTNNEMGILVAQMDGWSGRNIELYFEEVCRKVGTKHQNIQMKNIGKTVKVPLPPRTITMNDVCPNGVLPKKGRSRTESSISSADTNSRPSSASSPASASSSKKPSGMKTPNNQPTNKKRHSSRRTKEPTQEQKDDFKNWKDTYIKADTQKKMQTVSTKNGEVDRAVNYLQCAAVWDGGHIPKGKDKPYEPSYDWYCYNGGLGVGGFSKTKFQKQMEANGFPRVNNHGSRHWYYDFCSWK